VIIWREWRRPRSEWAWAVVAFLVSYVAVVDWYVADQLRDRWQVDVVSLVFIGLAGLLTFRVFVHARVTADARGVTIANPFRGDQHLEWAEIASMRADRLLIITDTRGERHIAWVIQKNGWTRATHRHDHADDAIDELGALGGRALNTTPRHYASVS
jgi:hypothetical protein